MGDHDRPVSFGERLEVTDFVDAGVLGRFGIGEEKVVVAQAGRVLLEAGDRHEPARLVELAHRGQHVRPAVPRHVEAAEPLVLDAVLVMADVGPIAVRREGEEIEMIAGDLERPRQRALGIADRVVVVQVAEVDVVILRLGLLAQARSRIRSKPGSRSDRRTLPEPLATCQPLIHRLSPRSRLVGNPKLPGLPT